VRTRDGFRPSPPGSAHAAASSPAAIDRGPRPRSSTRRHCRQRAPMLPYDTPKHRRPWPSERRRVQAAGEDRHVRRRAATISIPRSADRRRPAPTAGLLPPGGVSLNRLIAPVPPLSHRFEPSPPPQALEPQPRGWTTNSLQLSFSYRRVTVAALALGDAVLVPSPRAAARASPVSDRHPPSGQLIEPPFMTGSSVGGCPRACALRAGTRRPLVNGSGHDPRAKQNSPPRAFKENPNPAYSHACRTGLTRDTTSLL